ncbi:MAG TPA: hypothetical protein DCZ92_08850 [Elusimicrobia bacterium]|nr:MAG: hypothetical protein A2016_01675 [Elusimicrobia bacterium GWF2_62_30]HBA60913.1 hypothetical protein [Elusimicrobiota bacterium]
MKNILLSLFMLLGAGPGWAAEAKPALRWASASEYYFVLPAPQNLAVDGAGSTVVRPWGFGVRAVGHDTFSKTGGLQLQSVKVDHAGVKATFTMLDLIVGLEYLSPLNSGQPLRFKAGAYADLGLSDSTLYAAPMLGVGLLYTTDQQAETPAGFTLDVFCRLTDIGLDNIGGGRSGTLKPALGFKLGYIIPGFWRPKK